MALLSPALLWLLATAPVLLFFYVWRSRHKRFVAPSVLLWQQAIQETEHRASWRLPIRHILLLLELIALALLGFSLARPAVSVGAPHQDIVLLDASVQMTATDIDPAARVVGTEQDGRRPPGPLPGLLPAAAGHAPPVSRFATAQALIGRMIDRLGPANSMSLIRVGSTARLVITSGDHGALHRALDGLRPEFGTPAMTNALLLAQHVAALGQGAQPHLTVLTARPVGGSGPPYAGYCGGTTARTAGACQVLRLGTSDDDQAVTTLAATCPAATAGAAGGDCTVFARIVNQGAQTVSEPVALYADGLPLPLAPQDAAYTVAAHSSLDLVFSAPRQAQTVELALGRHDMLSADDRRWAVLPHAGLRNVLIVSDEPSLLDRAVHALPNVRVADVASADYTDSAALAADVTIFDGWLPDGPLVGDSIIINPPQGNSFLPYDHAMRDPAVASIEERSPMARLLLDGVDLRALVVGSAPALALPAWAQPLVASNEGPLLFAGTRAPDRDTSATGAGTAPRLVVVGFGIAPPASNLSRLVAFPLLLGHAVDWLASGAGDLATARGTAGEPAWGVALPLDVRHSARGVDVLDPGKRRVPLATSPVDGSPIFVAGGAPGDYSVRQKGAGSAAADTHIVVNAEVSAGQGGSAMAAQVAGGLGAGIGHLLARQEIWWALVLAVLAVLSLEWWIYAKRT